MKSVKFFLLIACTGCNFADFLPIAEEVVKDLEEIEPIEEELLEIAEKYEKPN